MMRIDVTHMTVEQVLAMPTFFAKGGGLEVKNGRVLMAKTAVSSETFEVVKKIFLQGENNEKA